MRKIKKQISRFRTRKQMADLIKKYKKQNSRVHISGGGQLNARNARFKIVRRQGVFKRLKGYTAIAKRK